MLFSSSRDSSPPAAKIEHHQSSLSLSTSDDTSERVSKNIGQIHSSLSVTEEDETFPKATARGAYSSISRDNFHVVKACATLYGNRCNHGIFHAFNCSDYHLSSNDDEDIEREFKEVLKADKDFQS